MLNKQTVQTIGIQAENMNKRRKLPKKDEWQNAENRSFISFGQCHRNTEASRLFPITCKIMTGVGFLSI